jgi:hypothetical protein
MGEFQGDLDYLVWMSVKEESYLYEFLSRHRAEWPDVADTDARLRIQEKLVALLDQGSIAVYVEKWAQLETYRELSLLEAKAAVRDERNWRPPQETEWFHFVYALRDAYPSWPSR